jgi:H+/Cl- antiporter ClcA
MVVQSILSLIAPIALMFFFAYLLVSYASTPTFIYVIFIILGVFSGLFSMVSFLIKASKALEALEKQHDEKELSEKVRRKEKDESGAE